VAHPSPTFAVLTKRQAIIVSRSSQQSLVWTRSDCTPTREVITVAYLQLPLDKTLIARMIGLADY
jgi:hypothetical protein